MDMIESMKKEIQKRCESENNFFGFGIYGHIESVAHNAVELAKLYQADIEICEIAGWLHDIASITDYQFYQDHHIHGARMAGEMLEAFHYPPEKIERVKLCIMNHRGSALNSKTTKEEICVADADAISHFDTLPSLFYLAFVQRKLSIEDGTRFVKEKLERSYNKMSGESKAYYKNKKDSVLSILEESGSKQMNHFTNQETQNALQAITSMIDRSKKAQEKFAQGTSQHTLQINRIHALHIAASLIEQQENGATDTHTKEELERARAPLASLISKSEKARQKLKQDTWQHTMLKNNLEALHIAETLLEKELQQRQTD